MQTSRQSERQKIGEAQPCKCNRRDTKACMLWPADSSGEPRDAGADHRTAGRPVRHARHLLILPGACGLRCNPLHAPRHVHHRWKGVHPLGRGLRAAGAAQHPLDTGASNYRVSVIVLSHIREYPCQALCSREKCCCKKRGSRASWLVALHRSADSCIYLIQLDECVKTCCMHNGGCSWLCTQIAT